MFTQYLIGIIFFPLVGSMKKKVESNKKLSMNIVNSNNLEHYNNIKISQVSTVDTIILYPAQGVNCA
jgi:hypothetical protein